MYKGLCLKSGYFDSRVEWYPGEDKSETEKQYLSLYNELYFYIQSIIPNFEPYEFGKM